MNSIFTRLTALIGEEASSLLSKKHIMIFGVGGVGSYAAEAIARSGIGHITVVDFDTVNETNINRQLCALHSTIGKNKVSVISERLRDINPNATVIADTMRYTKDSAEHFFSQNPDYIIDAIDCVTDKVHLIYEAKTRGIPIISAMGAGNKLNASAFKVADISKTTTCPLAKVMRKELGIRGIKHHKVVFSDELPVCKDRTPGSAAWVIGVAGLLLAGEAINDLLKETD